MAIRQLGHLIPTRLLEFFFPLKARSDFSPASLIFRREFFPVIVGEIGALLAMCRDDLPRAVDGAPFDLDVATYHRLNDAGMSRIYVARAAGELVGFAFFSILRHLHYRGHLWGPCDLLVVHPAWRACGWRTKPWGWVRRFFGIAEQSGLDAFLLVHAEGQLRFEGVEIMQASAGGALPARTLRHLGYVQREGSFVKQLRR